MQLLGLAVILLLVYSHVYLCLYKYICAYVSVGPSVHVYFSFSYITETLLHVYACVF